MPSETVTTTGQHERRGTILRITRSGTGFYLRWDGRKSEDSLHGDYLELAEGP